MKREHGFLKGCRENPRTLKFELKLETKVIPYIFQLISVLCFRRKLYKCPIMYVMLQSGQTRDETA